MSSIKGRSSPSNRGFGAVRSLPSAPPASTPGAREAESSVLVVDPDGVSRRFVELSLRDGDAAGARFAVESVKDATSALDVMRMSAVDLVVAETDLPDMNGTRFLRRLQQEGRLRGIPFVFFSADKRVPSKVAALGMGADDYIEKPCDARELRARIERLLMRGRHLRNEERRRSYTLAGDFSTVSFPDLVSILELARRTGLLSIATTRAMGQLFLAEGQVVHAVFGNLTGPDAFYRMMVDGDGHFEFTTTSQDKAPERSVFDSVTQLIMEAARQLDHGEHTSAELRAPASRRAGDRRSVPPLAAPLEPLSATRSLAAQFELGVSDAFSLGELQLLSHDELSRWTRAASAAERLHVHVVADLGAGVSALLGLAAQPTEGMLLSGLSSQPKALCLTFSLRASRTLDLVLIDIKNAGELRPSLQRRAELMIFAPPNGDFLDIGTKAMVDLERLLQLLSPAMLLGIGNASLQTALRKLCGNDAAPLPISCQPGTLGEASTDLRALLVRGIREWARVGRTQSLAPPSRPPPPSRRRA
ncbi:MAG: response regulator [Polyangiaceae bacterium]